MDLLPCRLQREPREPGDVAVNVLSGAFHGVEDAGSGSEMHEMGEQHHIEELREEAGIVDVAIDDEDAARG